jgi:CRISPR-associated DxTHG motif protein
MKKIITFLGIQAKKTTYCFQGQNYDGEVFAEALHKFCNYDSMLVCVTSEAKEKTFPILEKLEDKRIQAVEIPTGQSTEEMWETFKIINQKVNENDSVIFDITHGLRSLPFLVFLFAAYLKAAKKVEIEAIYYGAWELGFSNNGIAPVIDLSRFIDMLDWLTATERFVQIGDGQPLADLLKKEMPSKIELRDSIPAQELKRDLEAASKAIESISLALRLTRPIETMEQATKLEEALKKAAPSIAKRVQPFSILGEQVVKEYGQFALENPRENSQLANNLWLQLKMIEWYRERQQIVQAVTLTREWIVSVLALKFGEPMFSNKNGRDEVELALNNGVRIKSNKTVDTTSSCDDKLEKLANKDELVNLWDQVTQLRNDIAHVGMNSDPKSAKKLKDRFEKIYPSLSELVASLLPPQENY